MEDHIRDLLRDGRYAGAGPSRFQYSEQLKETAVFRILFGGEDASQVMADLGIHSGYTLRSWVQLYRQRMQTGLLTLPAMKKAQKQDIDALKQRNGELEQALQSERRPGSNLLILALNTMIEVAEKDGAARAVEGADPKKVWSQSVRRCGRTTQTVLTLRDNEIAKVSVGSLCRLFDGPPPISLISVERDRKSTTFDSRT